MFKLLRSLLSSILLKLFVSVDRSFGENLKEEVYVRSWPLYDWIFGIAAKVSPFPLPPIYEENGD
jgi:hypothetical protein